MRLCSAAGVREQRLERNRVETTTRGTTVPRATSENSPVEKRDTTLLTIQPKPCQSSCCCNKCGQPAANRCPSPIPQTLRPGQPNPPSPRCPRALGEFIVGSRGCIESRFEGGGRTTRLVREGPAYLGPWSRNHFLPRFVIHPPFLSSYHYPAFHYPDTTPPAEHRRQPKTFQTLP